VRSEGYRLNKPNIIIESDSDSDSDEEVIPEHAQSSEEEEEKKEIQVRELRMKWLDKLKL
jgi:hypothetical protein